MSATGFERVVFWNGGGKGDVHVSREYVKYFANLLSDIDFSYAHAHGSKVLEDVHEIKYSSDLTFRNGLPKSTISQPSFRIGETIYANTWYGVSPSYNGCNIGTLHRLFSHHANTLGIGNLPSMRSFIPKIDYKLLDTTSIDDYLSTDNRKKILFCNNVPLSLQSFYDGPLDGLINLVAKECQDATVFVTNKAGTTLPNNVVDVGQLTSNHTFNQRTKRQDTEKFDLNHISYISTKCDIIVGRSSGPDTYCIVEENVSSSDLDYFVICPKPLARSFFDKSDQVGLEWREHEVLLPYNEKSIASLICAALRSNSRRKS